MRLFLLIFFAVYSAQQSKPFRINANNRDRPSTSCTTPENQLGTCVKPQYCTEELPEVDNTPLFIFRESACSYLLKCCPVDQVKPVPKRTNTLPQGCGWSNPGGYRIRTSDSDPTDFSNFADFPWMVALLTRSFGKQWSPNDYIGGGTLIHPSVVLTVAHKVDTRDANELKCRAGEWDFQSEDEIYIHQDRNVRKISIHKDFFKSRLHYDAALLFLETPFQLGKEYHIGTACLARDMPPHGTLCYSMGWGRTINKDEKTSLLKKIWLPMVDSETCQREVRKTPSRSTFRLHNTQFCAGGDLDRAICIGDGGSSLVCPTSNDNPLKRYLVYGMVAYGLNFCGGKDAPVVSAKVPSMLDWIDRQMLGEQYGTETYYMS